MSIIEMNLSTPQTTVSAARSNNKLLASLPLEDYQRIAPHLRTVPMKPKQTLQKQDEPIDSVIFPTGGCCSLVKTLHDGDAAEVVMIGAEGAIGTSVFFGQRDAECQVMVQVAAPAAESLTADFFNSEMERRGALFNRVIRYNQALMSQVMQTAVCNGLHSVEQRCARWLLMTQDHAGSNEFPITHELMATMLGVRRPTVTLVISALAVTGLVSHVRGHMRILDRKGLEAASCECYQIVKSAARRLLSEGERSHAR